MRVAWPPGCLDTWGAAAGPGRDGSWRTTALREWMGGGRLAGRGWRVQASGSEMLPRVCQRVGRSRAP